MRKFFQYFASGILVLAPIVLTFYVISRVLGLLEGLGATLLPGSLRVPGLGVVTAVLLITLVGFVGRFFIARQAIALFEHLMRRIPLVKGLYGGIKDIIGAFGGTKQSFSKVVLVRAPGWPLEILGFVTAEDLALLGDPGRDRVAVFIPQSLQLGGGFIAIVPRACLTVLDTPPQAALRFLMTAGMTGEGN